jgi:hypothetical protein
LDRKHDRANFAEKVAGGISLILAAVLFASGVSAFSLASILANHRGPERFKIIHVRDLARLIANKQAHAYVFDADPSDVREKEGVIPGAALLSSSGDYDIGKELPSDRNVELVFYCHDLH